MFINALTPIGLKIELLLELSSLLRLLCIFGPYDKIKKIISKNLRRASSRLESRMNFCNLFSFPLDLEISYLVKH